MDLLTQGVLGAALAQSAAQKQETRIAAGVGFAAGLLADADTLIRSASDPLLELEFHRHFTHALAFVPVGALVAAAILWPFLRKRIAFPRLYLYAFLGYALAGFLDACTSYGTHLFWPFSEGRVSWSLISIVDPVFTLLLAVPLAIGVIRQRARAAQVGLALAAAYLSLGFLQHERAATAAQALAVERGHRPERLLVKPTFGNVLLWRSTYIADGRIHADGIRIGLGEARVYRGESAELFDPARDLPWAPPGSGARLQAERFMRFADGYAARHPARPELIGDARYAMLPTRVAPLWGVVYDGNRPDAGVRFVTDRALTPEMRQRFLDMLYGRP
jgi:inner membrane protein